MTLDLKAIRAAAEGATPGPWILDTGDNSHRYSRVIGENEHTVHYKYGSGNAASADQDKRDAHFIAALDPTTVIALVARVERLSNEHADECERHGDTHFKLTNRIERLEAALKLAENGLIAAQVIGMFCPDDKGGPGRQSAVNAGLSAARAARAALAEQVKP